MPQGRVIKAYNSFFYVETEGALVTCKLRGKFKKRQGVYPGDLVDVRLLPDGTGVVERLLPRESLMRRPLVANVDQVVLTFAAAQPDPHPLLVSRFLVLAEWSGLARILVCVNKSDLPPAAEESFKVSEAAGYQVLHVSAQTGAGVDALRRELANHITCFAGPSGVGKSSLLNAIEPGLSLQTGHVSEKIKRGRHTTRVAELLPFAGGYIVDTPGFSSMELDGIDEQLLPSYFPEFRPYLGHCRFSPCSHSHEPDCAVKEAVAAGNIPQERYDAYLSILEEIHANQKKY
ncbi:ribosome small subunit-dependent GTPase A [uncultured Selenomonas sp.]|uniref:ribosome small subunit-dependent GTPase A n=1 Tax=uncultured Selenomonas sp. TaxID=159275 RepID=UPI0025E50943|nr:ribosome small subunit-dependent GTPase A [uncultured Selenomonas sp.]MDD6696873.1 ribosome small subunit-dependent GTPase A [Veillonellaceae bacterium]